jgi:GcrA cell cycle regulator
MSVAEITRPDRYGFWTPERVEKLLALAKDHSAAEIAEEFGEGVTRSAVIGKLNRMGLGARAGANKKAPRKPQKLTRLYVPSVFLVPAQAPKPAPPVVSIEPRNITIMDLQRNDCRYITTETGPVLYCGLRKQKGSSYCSHHHSLTHYEVKLK